MMRLTTVSCRSGGKIFSDFFRFQASLIVEGLIGLALRTERASTPARIGDRCRKDTDHPISHPWVHPAVRASARRRRGCIWRDDYFGRGQNTLLGGSDPTFAYGSVAKVMLGVAPVLKEIPARVLPACVARIRTKQVKKVRTTLCTFRTATSSPDAWPAEFVLKDLQRPPPRKSPRKKGQIGRERPHFFAVNPPKSFLGSLPPLLVLRVDVLRGCLSWSKDLSDKMSDILYEHERRSPLSILKSPPKQPKAVTVQARVEESVKTQLDLYAEFIDASTSYVITEALKLLFRKD